MTHDTFADGTGLHTTCLLQELELDLILFLAIFLNIGNQ